MNISIYTIPINLTHIQTIITNITEHSPLAMTLVITFVNCRFLKKKTTPLRSFNLLHLFVSPRIAPWTHEGLRGQPVSLAVRNAFECSDFCILALKDQICFFQCQLKRCVMSNQ